MLALLKSVCLLQKDLSLAVRRLEVSVSVSVLQAASFMKNVLARWI